jgi:hypothetical protein
MELQLCNRLARSTYMTVQAEEPKVKLLEDIT